MCILTCSPKVAHQGNNNKLHSEASDVEGHAGIDFSAIDELDPSLVDGFRVFYEREVPFELRSAAGRDSPTEV